MEAVYIIQFLWDYDFILKLFTLIFVMSFCGLKYKAAHAISVLLI